MRNMCCNGTVPLSYAERFIRVNSVAGLRVNVLLPARGKLLQQAIENDGGIE